MSVMAETVRVPEVVMGAPEGRSRAEF
jgi:hypothetical protein